jgi:pyruvate dehydrogenase E2 component (dihydrolipoamide acetyltransferase)
MVREFKLPDVGEGLTEAEIVSWLVEVGDTVTEDQPVAEVETDKAVVEVPSPVNGTVREIRAEEGEMVPVGEVIITFDVEGEPAEPTEPAEPVEEPAAREADMEGASEGESEPAVTPADEEGTEAEPEPASRGGRTFAAPSARRLARELGVDISAVEGSGPGGRVTESDVRAAAEAGEEPGAGPEPAEPESGTRSAVRRVDETEGEPAAARRTATSGDGVTAGPEPAGRDRTLAAPATRRLAEEEGVDLDDVPTDETHDGEPFVAPEQVTEYAEAQRAAQEADVEAVSAEAGAGTAKAGGDGAAAPETGTTAEGEVERRPYRGIRRTIGQAMERSKYTAPHVSHHDRAVVDDLVAIRERLKPRAEERGARLTYLPFVIKAVVAALRQHPILNSQLDEENEEILVKRYYNIGVAVATDAGLMVPVVENAGEKDMLAIGAEVNELAGKARDRSIEREEMQGGTFTVTNFGAIGGEYATPIINYPETAILGLGALEQRPVVEDGEVVARHTLPLSLSIDHRVVDGADAARFANTLIEYLENPDLLLLE